MEVVGMTNNRDHPGIKDRSFRFSVRILNLVRAMPRDVAGQMLARQVARSGTGIGSNVEEAQAAHTKREFAHKMNIARVEARETLYWLRLVRETKMLSENRLRDLLTESNELVSILTAIVRTSKKRNGADGS
jgi:four helix bundle protein